MKTLFKSPLLVLALLAVVFASACTAKNTGQSVADTDVTDTVDPTLDDTKVNETNTTKLSVIDDEDDEKTTTRSSRRSSRTNDDDDEDEENGTVTSSNDEEEENETPSTSTNTNTPSGGDSNVQLSIYEGPANTTIKYSASGFDSAETVEIRMTGLYYTAATFYSHDGTIPPSDLYIPLHNSAGEPMSGKIEIVARGTRSGKEFTAYYTVNE